MARYRYVLDIYKDKDLKFASIVDNTQEKKLKNLLKNIKQNRRKIPSHVYVQQKDILPDVYTDRQIYIHDITLKYFGNRLRQQVIKYMIFEIFNFVLVCRCLMFDMNVKYRCIALSIL